MSQLLHVREHISRHIHILNILAISHPPWGGGIIFVQIEKQGRIPRRTALKRKGKGGKRRKKDSDKTHVKIPL